MSSGSAATSSPAEDVVVSGHIEFLTQLRVEKTRLTRTLSAVSELILIYEGLSSQRGDGSGVIPAKAAPAVTPPPPVPPANVPPLDKAERPSVPVAPSMWTEERKAVLEKHYPTVLRTEQILELLNMLPGPRVPFTRVAIQAGKMGLNRPPEYGWSHRRDLPPKPSRIDIIRQVAASMTNAKSSFEAVSADFATVRRWAGERGVQFETWDDLPAVNERRERLEIAPFKREFPTKGRVG